MDNNKKDFFLPGSILVAALLISGSIIYMVGSKNSANTSNQVPLAGDVKSKVEVSSRDVILGDTKAPVTLIEYGDYQCPWCGKFFTEVEDKLRKGYIESGKVKMVYRNFAFIGPESFAAAEAAECAKDQSKFWVYHDELYRAEHKDGAEKNGNLNRDLFLKIATDLKLNLASFTSCLDADKYAKQVETDTAEGRSAGVRGTPAIFINGEQVGNGFVEFESAAGPSLKGVIDELLK
ncbi:MAG: DSBA oxidoreductase [Parcubacteria group bacterium Gr01-1014_20]|nr:MAG: DSBA oxidoreductase [Parcubacteria group bacterium Gr01-1014_20]